MFPANPPAYPAVGIDLWAQFRLLDGGERLGRYISHYRYRWFEPGKRNGQQVFTWKPKSGAEQEIYSAIGDMTVSMKTTDHLRLPELTFNTIEVEMGDQERKAYEELKTDMVLSLGEDTIDAANAAVLSGKLAQLASGAIYTDDNDYSVLHGLKLDALEDLIEAANGQPLLVAYWYQHEAQRICQRFPEARLLKTAQDFEAWNKSEIPLALIHPASAGHGLNLQTGGHLLVWFSLTWSLELYLQTNARLYRQGQAEPVTITHLTVADTLESSILKALSDKDDTQDRLIEAVKTELGKEN